MKEYNYDDAIAITKDIYWVGFYDAATYQHCNPYLLIDGDEAVLFDSGSTQEFPTIMRKIIDLISPEKISLVVLANHNPDACANLSILEDLIGITDLKIAAHTNTLRLINNLGLASTVYAVDEHDYSYTLKSGRILSFHPTLYLHAPGAIATYDAKSKSLFSSDLFGAEGDQWALFDSAKFPHDMDSFHQDYMPSNEVLRFGLKNIEHLDIARILPQRGSVIEGSNVSKAFTHLKKLNCGIDLIDN